MNGNRLENFPVSFFAMVMGMAGITIAWQKCATLLHFGSSVYAMLVPFYDQGDLVEQAVNTVSKALIEAFVLIVIVLLLFLLVNGQ